MENMTLNYKEFCNVCFALLQAKDEMKDFKLKLENNDCGDICVHAIVELDAKTSVDAYFYLTDYYRNTYLVNKTSVRDIVDCLAKLILGSFKEYKDEMKLDKKLGFEEFMKELTTCLQANPQLFEFTFERDKEDDYILNVFAKIPGDTARNCLDVGRLYTGEYLENGKSLKDIVVFLSDILFNSFQEYKKNLSDGDKLCDTLEESLYESITVYVKDRISHGEDPDEIFKDCQKKISDNYEEMVTAGFPLAKEDVDTLVADVYNVIEQLKAEKSQKANCYHPEPDKYDNYKSLRQNMVDNFIKEIKAVTQPSINSGVPGDVILNSFDNTVRMLADRFEDFNPEAIDIKNARSEIAKMIDERDKVEETFEEIARKELEAIRSDVKKLLDDGVDGKTVLARFDRVGDAVVSLFATMGDTEDIREKDYYKDLRNDIVKMCEEKDKTKENSQPVTNSDLTDKVTEDAIKSFVESLNRTRRKK